MASGIRRCWGRTRRRSGLLLPSGMLLLLAVVLLGKSQAQAFIAAPPFPQTRAPNLSSGCHRTALPRPLAAASDSGGSEEERRRRIMALQREVAEDILASSEAEREAAEAKKRALRMATRRKVYEAYSKVGGEVSLTEIGVPKKMTRMSKTSYADEKKTGIARGKSYASRKAQLQFDSLWLSFLGLAATWAFVSYEASVSYGLGALLGLGYVTLLARSVEALGTGGPGAGVGQARFGMVILLVLFAGKYRDTVQLIPALVGFSMYQVASFLQAFDRAAPPTEEKEAEEKARGGGQEASP